MEQRVDGVEMTSITPVKQQSYLWCIFLGRLETLALIITVSTSFEGSLVSLSANIIYSAASPVSETVLSSTLY